MVIRLRSFHFVAFGGFASKELASCIDRSTPKVIITASCGVKLIYIVLYRPSIEGALLLHQCEHKVENVVVVIFDAMYKNASKLGPINYDYEELISNASPTYYILHWNSQGCPL